MTQVKSNWQSCRAHPYRNCNRNWNSVPPEL